MGSRIARIAAGGILQRPARLLETPIRRQGHAEPQLRGDHLRVLAHDLPQQIDGLPRLAELLQVEGGEIELERYEARVAGDGGLVAALRLGQQALLGEQAGLGLEHVGLAGRHRDGAAHPVAGEPGLALGLGGRRQAEHGLDGARIALIGLAEGAFGLVEVFHPQGRLAPRDAVQLRAARLGGEAGRRAGDDRFGTDREGRHGKPRRESQDGKKAGSMHDNLENSETRRRERRRNWKNWPGGKIAHADSGQGRIFHGPGRGPATYFTTCGKCLSKPPPKRQKGGTPPFALHR